MAHRSNYRVPTPRVDRPKAPDGPSRFSVGLFDFSDRRIEREGARSLFLRELFDTCPEAWHDFKRQQSVEHWVADWHLTGAPWITDWADLTKRHLNRKKAHATMGADFASYHGEPYLDPLAEDFPRSELTAAIAANPLEEDRATFMQRAEVHWGARVELLKGQGFQRVNSKPSLDHIHWLIRYQVEGESFAEIARDGTDKSADRPKTVTRAIKNLARLIELPLRPGRSGRPPETSAFTTP